MGDVDSDYGKKGGRGVRRGHHRRADVRPYRCTVFASITLFKPIAGLPTSDDRTEEAARLCPILLVRKFEYGKVSNLVLGISKRSLECRIHAENAAVEIARCNADRRRLKDGPPALIARAQRRFGLHASANVDVNRLQEGSGGLDFRHQRCRGVPPNQAAVLFYVLLFVLNLCE